MIPKGLKPPARDAFRFHPGGVTPPVDYPARLPFVPNEPCKYGETDSVAMCVWDLGTAHPAERAAIRDGIADFGADSSRSTLIDPQRMKDWARLLTASPAAQERLDALLQSLTLAARADGWLEAGAPTLVGPPGSSFRRFVRDGQVMVVMAMAMSLSQGLSVLSFADQAA